jgi:hypothetical protein
MAEGKSQIAFEELGLGSLLKRYRLRVPTHQREYAWTEREISALLTDFAAAINDEGPYFLGTVVTIPREEGTLEVVDGQQRLATTAMLLAAIRDYAKKSNEDFLVRSIETEFLSGPDRERREDVPKLTLNVDDNELFRRIIVAPDEQPDILRGSHRRLAAARKEAQKQVQRIVAPLDAKDHVKLLNEWVSFIEFRAIVILLRVPSDADAFRMFETLNDRGLRTSQADLIKNYLFSRGNGRIAEIQSRWSYMRGALETNSDDPEITITFLRHALVTQEGYVRDSQIFDRIQRNVKSQQAAVAFSATLEALANAYVATFNSDHERWNGYPDAGRRAIEVLNLIDIKPMRPLILAIAAKMDPREASRAFRFLIGLAVRLMIAGSKRGGAVEEPLANTAKQVFDGDVATAAQLRDALSDITPSNRDFEEKFAEAKVSNARLAKYYLRSLEMAHQGQDEPEFVPQEDTQIINLEHVLPKSPGENWQSFPEDDVPGSVNRLGNQALLRATSNSDLKSSAFADKKVIYAQSSYALTSQIAEAPEWTPLTIAARQEILAEMAVKTWPAK